MHVLRDFTYILRNPVLDLPSVVSNGDDFFVCFTTEDLVENGHENPKIFKKRYWNWLLAILAFF